MKRFLLIVLAILLTLPFISVPISHAAQYTYTVTPSTWTSFSDGHGGNFSYKGDKSSDRVIVRVAGQDGGNFAKKRRIEIVFNSTVYGNFTVRNGDGPISKIIGYSTLYSGNETGTKYIYVKIYNADDGSLYTTEAVIVTRTLVESAPVCSISADSINIQVGDSTTLRWNVTNNPDYATISNIGHVAASGSQTVSPRTTTTYKIDAGNDGGACWKSVVITVTDPPPTDTAPEFLNQGSVSPDAGQVNDDFTFTVRARDVDGDDISAFVNITDPGGNQSGWQAMSRVSGTFKDGADFSLKKNLATEGEYRYQFQITSNGQNKFSQTKIGPTVEATPDSEQICIDNGGYWYDGACHSEPKDSLWTTRLKITNGITLSTSTVEKGQTVNFKVTAQNTGSSTPQYDSWGFALHDSSGDRVQNIHLTGSFTIPPNGTKKIDVPRTIDVSDGDYYVYCKVEYNGSWYYVSPASSGQKNPVPLEVTDTTKPTGTLSGVPDAITVGGSFTVSMQASDDQELKKMTLLVNDGAGTQRVKKPWDISGKSAPETYTVQTDASWTTGTCYVALWVADAADNTSDSTDDFVLNPKPSPLPPPEDPPEEGGETTPPGTDETAPTAEEVFARLDEILGGNGKSTAEVQDPINTAQGNYVYKHTDLVAPTIGNDLTFSRVYDTLMADQQTTLGHGWRHSWMSQVVEDEAGKVKLYRETGSVEHYELDRTEVGVNYYLPVLESNRSQLIRKADGDYLLTTKNHHKYEYQALTRDEVNLGSVLTKWMNRNGREIALNYDKNGVTSVVSASDGKTLFTFNYDGIGQLIEVQGPENQSVSFDYLDGNLVTATDALDQSTAFEYDAGHLITQATDPLGYIFLRNNYDDDGRVIDQYDAEDSKSELAYADDPHTTTVTKRDGAVEVYEYDQKYRILKYTDPLGNVTQYTYDTNGNRTSVTDPKGYVTLYDYDDRNNLIEITDSFGKVTTFAYNDTDDLISKTDALSQITDYTLDSKGRVTKIRDPLNNETNYTYTSDGLLDSVTDANGEITSYGYDASGNRTSQTDPLSNTARWEFDAAGRVIAQFDPLGNKTTSAYDVCGQMLSITDPAGNTKSFEYNANGKVTTQTDEIGENVTFGYDLNDRLITTTHATSDRATQIEYDAEDRPIKKTVPGNRETLTEYDVLGRPVKVTDALGKVSILDYDANGNLISETDPLGRTTTYGYDSLNRRIWTADPLGYSAYFYYDALGRLVKTVDAEGRTVIEKQFDAANRLVEEKDGLGNTTSYTHDAVGNVISKSDPLGNVTTYVYDANNRLISTIDALGGESCQKYDAAGNRTSLTGPNGSITEFGYDGNGRVISEADALSYTKNYAYDARGLLASVTNARGQEIRFEYDSDRLITKVIYPEETLIYSYNDAGEVIDIERDGDNDSVSYARDGLGRPTQRIDTFGLQLSYKYNAAGNLTELQYPGGQNVLYAYDAASRLSTVTDWNGRQTKYTYDRAGLLVGTTRPDGSVATYSYDVAKRLTSLSDSGSKGIIASYSYTLDAAGQRVKVSCTEQLPPVLPSADQDFSYDTANRQLSALGISQEFDSDGNLTVGCLESKSVGFTYDSRKRLSSAAGVQYEYDSEDLRISAVGSGGGKFFVVNPVAGLSQVLEVRDSAAGAVLARYVYGLGLISREDGDGSDYRVYHFDSRGSTVALTDSDGKVMDAYTYGVFGELMKSVGNIDNPFCYNGRDGVMLDGNGLYYMRSRYYNPETKRFLSRDSLLGDILEGQSLNRYAYVTNNPVSFIDPLGLSAIAGAVPIGIGLSAADGPLPIGELAALGYFVGAGIYDLTKWLFFDSEVQTISGRSKNIKNLESAEASPIYYGPSPPPPPQGNNDDQIEKLKQQIRNALKNLPKNKRDKLNQLLREHYRKPIKELLEDSIENSQRNTLHRIANLVGGEFVLGGIIVGEAITKLADAGAIQNPADTEKLNTKK